MAPNDLENPSHDEKQNQKQNVPSLLNLLSQFPSLYSANNVNAVYCESSLPILLRYNQDKKNDKWLLSLQIISFIFQIENVSSLSNYLFQTLNLYSTDKGYTLYCNIWKTYTPIK